MFNQVSHQQGLSPDSSIVSIDIGLFRQPANIAFFLITINGMTYNQTAVANLSTNPLLLATIAQANSQLLCPSSTQILPMQNSIQDFHVPCPIPQL